MKLVRLILLITLLLAMAVLLFQNQQALGMPVELGFLSWRLSLVLGFWILFAFAAGVALFALADTWRGMLLRMEIRRKDAEIARLNNAARNAAGNPAPVKTSAPEETRGA